MTNAAAIGYMMMAAEELGYSQDQIDNLAAEMKYQIDICHEEAAEEVYRKS